MRYWSPAIAWVVVILIASSDLMSAEHTSRFIGPFLRWIMPDITAATVVGVQLWVRKGAHLTEYAILAALTLRAVKGEARRLRRVHVLAALALAAACACADEFHQSLIASRTGSAFDVMLDVAGAAAGVGLYWALRRRKSADGVAGETNLRT